MPGRDVRSLDCVGVFLRTFFLGNENEFTYSNKESTLKIEVLV
jgi:hypothetical protein